MLQPHSTTRSIIRSDLILKRFISFYRAERRHAVYHAAGLEDVGHGVRAEAVGHGVIYMASHIAVSVRCSGTAACRAGLAERQAAAHLVFMAGWLRVDPSSIVSSSSIRLLRQ